jgi:signal transduction histidine kinase/ActR/RegA family two-component response regulator
MRADSTGAASVTIIEGNKGIDARPRDAYGRQLLELTTRLSGPLPTEEVARVVVDQAAAGAGALTAVMWTVDDPPTHATLVRAIGCEQRQKARYARIPLEPWLPMGDAILRREVLFFESRADFRERYPVAEKGGPEVEAFRELSYACLPFVVHGRAIGGVSLVFPGVRAFGEDERVFLAVLAHHAAQALERANFVEREKATRERLQRLQQLTAALSSAATVEEIAQLATRISTEALALSSSAMWAIDEQGDLRLLGAHQTTEAILGPFRHMPGDSSLPGARVARERRPVWYESEADLGAEHPAVAEALGRGQSFRAYGAFPLVRDDSVLGVLVFSAGRPRRFSPEERSFAATIAEHCADALARARLYGDARRAERRLQCVLERLPVGAIVAEAPDGELVFTNDAMAHLWRAEGFAPRGEDPGKILRARFPDGRPLAKEDWPIVRALRGEVVEGQELRITRLNGAEGWIHVRAAPIRGDDGTIEAAVATAIDVTAEKAAHASADEASRAKDEFLAMLGHELRNPLAPIVTALHLMRLRGGGVLERERAVIERQVGHLTRLVDDLLDVSRGVRGELSLERAPVDVAAIVAEAIEMAAPLVKERRHQLTVSVPHTELFVEADSARLAQVITNLLTNAAKYTLPGGHITVLARADAGQVALEVADDGAGIEPELLQRVFDPFTQGRQGLDRRQGGLGLGLSIARQLVVAHGGTIEARSAGPGRGTTMVVRLPRGDAPLPASGHADDRASCEWPGAPRRVLVVDDNPDAAELLQEGLTLAGHEVRTADDGPTALQVVRTFTPEIAFLDIGLPVMDGYELAQHLRGVPGFADTPIVAVTGYAQDEDRQRALASGFTEHFAKPLRLDRVIECIERLCAGGRLTEDLTSCPRRGDL